MVVETRRGIGAPDRLPVQLVGPPRVPVEQVGDEVLNAGVKIGKRAERLDSCPCPARGGGHLLVIDAEDGQCVRRAEDDRRVDVGCFQLADCPLERGNRFVELTPASMDQGAVELGAGSTGAIPDSVEGGARGP